MIRLIVALGNPGPQYVMTRHNAGFLLADQWIHAHGFESKGLFKQSDVYEARRDGEKIWIIKPQTYMNESGRALRAFLQFYKIEPDEVLVVYDDIDLNLGRARLRLQGSAGTHNGLRSIIQHLGTQSIPRLRLGIGPKPGNGPLDRFVLSEFRPKEMDALEDVFIQLQDLFDLLFQADLNPAIALAASLGQE